ncbi:MAG: hypothetical protein IKV80_03815 [Bacteroidales bacterium]|nr:hypothetical protein [Bacteroidales bacterium]
MNNKTQEQVSKVSEMLNSFTFDYEGFCKEMTKEHRTLQQSFTRLCIHWLCTCASDDYRYDGRNEASHEIAKALIMSQDADFIGHIPMI